MERDIAKMDLKNKDEAIEQWKEDKLSVIRKRIDEKQEHEREVQERRAALEAERLERWPSLSPRCIHQMALTPCEIY